MSHSSMLAAGKFKQWGTWGADEIKRIKKANGRLFLGKEWNEYPVIKIIKSSSKKSTNFIDKKQKISNRVVVDKILQTMLRQA